VHNVRAQVVTGRRLATRHECALRLDVNAGSRHTAGPGKPRRQKCAGCGGQLLTRTGLYAVFVHSSASGDRRYLLESATSTHVRERDADAVIQADTTGTLVVRWVDVTP